MEASKEKLFATQIGLQMKDMENLRLNYEVKKTKMESIKAQTKAARKEYDDFTSKIESELGISLKGKVIDDVSFEVKELVEGE